MPLTTFHFTASLPAHRDYLEPLGRLISHALEYMGTSKQQADADAAALTAKLALDGRAGQQIEVRFRKDGERLHIELLASGHTHTLTRAVHDA
jgi:hypothetical protein